jgi:hypothetical protein
MHGLDPDLKHARAANYVRALRGELLSLSRALGVPHPALVDPDQVEIVSERYRSAPLREVFGYRPDWRTHDPATREEVMGLVGIGPGRRVPGPEAGPVLGDESGLGVERDTDLPDASGSASGAAGD